MTSGNNENGHQKHAKLQKPAIGNFGRNEVALMGTPCGRIKQLAAQIVEELSSQNKIGFVDADHKATDLEPAMEPGTALAFTDKINFRRFDYLQDFNQYQVRAYFNSCDMVLVNGNHFKAARQILIIDPKKPLERKLDRITEAMLVVTTGESAEIPGYLAPYIQDIPVVSWNEPRAIVEFLASWLQSRLPAVKGLVLAGGRSERMRQDKGSLNYHGISQRRFVYNQLESLGVPASISCRPDQVTEIEEGLPLLPDSYLGLGPIGGLMSAFREDPNSAWLAIACDLPYLTEKTIRYLLKHRDASKVATAFQSPFDKFPEPLITIWEPKSYLQLFEYLSQGYSCPRKVLINSEVALLEAPQPRELTNINHPHEYQQALKGLKS